VATGIRAQRATHVISRKVKRADYVAEAACIASDECPITRVRRQRMQLGDHPAIDIARRSHAAGTSGTRLLARRLLRLRNPHHAPDGRPNGPIGVRSHRLASTTSPYVLARRAGAGLPMLSTIDAMSTLSHRNGSCQWASTGTCVQTLLARPYCPNFLSRRPSLPDVYLLFGPGNGTFGKGPNLF
jgi:hypothetical protein